ncbi:MULTISPECIES: DNA adenine methylase [Mycolicibacterium]|uniref:DNA adenine methylase n=2 Tax=Mycolicibacterium TaxID=1866885 RepID=A0ABT6GZZ8_MYCGU|nr:MULTISPECIES: DNA adenine methylase [Mycolicibacterium]EHB45817.1 D12 class N6 adenine-specific DNA methyltransferase [Mycolicibacterium rhodesiae JS60]MCV7022873.1 DNA adenine methylase [Mycolicibacterium novocastrense]MDG5486590.1 DNA adenine methylase [Mycolicibacterium gadium]
MRADTAVVSPLAERSAGAQEAGARIAGMLPTHTHYVQLQSGGLEVLLHKPPSPAETINDTSLDIVTFWRVLRDRPDDLRRACALTPVSRIEFDTARGSGSHLGIDDLEKARRVWVRLSQSADGSARLRPQWRGIRRGRQHTDIEALAQRMREVTLECLPAVKVVEALGGHRGVCFYADLRANLYDAQGADPGAAFRPGPDVLLSALSKTKAAAVVRVDHTEVEMTAPPGWAQAALTVQSGHPVLLWSNRPPPIQQPLFDVAAATVGKETS